MLSLEGDGSIKVTWKKVLRMKNKWRQHSVMQFIYKKIHVIVIFKDAWINNVIIKSNNSLKLHLKMLYRCKKIK